jgi:glutaminyl-tRNA synthetase
MHWVSAAHAMPVEARLYDHIFAKPDPDEVEEGQSYLINLNPDSIRVLRGWAEPSVSSLQVGERVQFERLGYFCVDRDSKPELKVFNRTATLRDTWANLQRAMAPNQQLS